ncbi:MAG: amidophosphoribosyltransferase [Longimicrobiales bacterium]|nr:amidophosphoribosyltransferase [Longimicrobiales bacterium]
MSGFFGVASRDDCVHDLFFGTDYQSHLGTQRGGMAVTRDGAFTRFIHDIRNSQFRSKFEDDVKRLVGHAGVGVISDFEDQPILVSSHLGTFAIVTVGVVQNADALAREGFKRRSAHFSEVAGGGINPTELVATLINAEDSFESGIRLAQEQIEGSCSILVLTADGIWAARDRLGRTPVAIGRREGAWCAATESCALPNLGYEPDRDLGPGEIVRITAEGVERVQPPGDAMQICAFLWVYYGYPSSSYEGINVEGTRYRCGASLARRDDVEVDLVAGIPDSGTAHAIGYAMEAGLRYARPFAKYTPTWPRSFMPQDQSVRDLVARMKLIPIRELIAGQRILFCEDSIVRGTQLQDIVQRVYDYGGREVHMRPACPPLVFGCKFLNFSRSRSSLDLAARKAIREIEGDENTVKPEVYADHATSEHAEMVERIRSRLKLTTLRYQRLPDLVDAIGLPKEKLCTYCWDGCEGCAAVTTPERGP